MKVKFKSNGKQIGMISDKGEHIWSAPLEDADQIENAFYTLLTILKIDRRNVSIDIKNKEE